MTSNKLILPYPHLRAACIFARSQRTFIDPTAKSEVIIDTDGSIYGISESYIYRTPPKYAGLFRGELEYPISLEIPPALLPNWVSSVAITMPTDMENPQYTLMAGHDLLGNPAENCWSGIFIKKASDDGFNHQLKTLEATKKLIAGAESGEYEESTDAIGISPRMLTSIIEALDIDPTILPKEYRQLSMKFYGAESPIKIDLGAIEGILLTMPASAALIKNSESELEY